MEKHRWQKAENTLRKALSRDSLNTSVRYILSVFYFHPGNPGFQLDSAHEYAVGAMRDFTHSPPRLRDRLKRIGTDSLKLVRLRASIDSAAFQVAKSTNTEAAYLQFLSRFPFAAQRDQAIYLRNEVAYQNALDQHSPQAFLTYVTRYPSAHRVDEAMAQYHRLLYLERTKDGRLVSFETFLADHPDTPYRAEIYQNIFEIMTADGRVASFLSYLRRYPVSRLATKAENLVFHLLAEDDDATWPAGFLNDSLRNLLDLNSSYLVPFLSDGQFGFMNEQGTEVIAPQYADIHPDYLCGQVMDEVLIVDNRLVARDGNTVFHGAISDVSDIGAGFLRVEMADGVKVIHKSGFELTDDAEDARIIARTFVAVKKEGRWLPYSLAGRLLDTRAWDDISAMGDVVVFTRNGKRFVIAKAEMGRGAEGDPLPLSEPFDDLRLWPGGLIWGKAGQYEGVLNQSLQTVIRFDMHSLAQMLFGALAQVPNGVVVYNRIGRKSTVFEQVSLLSKRIGVKWKGSWFLYDPLNHAMYARAYDSLRAEGPFVVGSRGDSLYVGFQENVFRAFYRPRRIGFVPGLDSMSFLIVQEKGPETTVFDLKGQRLFSATFEAIEYAGNGVFVVTRKGKRGLVDLKGKTRQAEFDAIGTAQNDVVSLLRNRKFGAYHTRKGKLIKPQYDRNPIPYGPSFVVTFRNGYYKFVDWDNKPLSNFEFEEVRYWNDSLALVKNGLSWSIFNLAGNKPVETDIRGINIIRDSPAEKLAIIQKGNYFGVIDNRGHTIIPPVFSEIINLGTPEAPLYFTEKHIPETSVYVVIYFDRTGEAFREEIYKDVAHFDRIYCSE